MTTVEPQMLKGVLALLLLRLVDDQEDYGYSLVQRLRAAGLTDAAEGSVYPALARLEARGLLAPRMVREGRGPGRRYYRPTAAGLDEVVRLQRSFDAVDAAVRSVAPGAASPAASWVARTDGVADPLRQDGSGPGSVPDLVRGG